MITDDIKRLYKRAKWGLVLRGLLWIALGVFIVVRPLEFAAWLSDVADRWLIDGLVNFLGWLPRAAGSLRRQT